MAAIQLDLFEEVTEISMLRKEIDLLHQSNDNVRKGLFARLNAMGELVLKQQAEIDKLSQIVKDVKPLYKEIAR